MNAHLTLLFLILAGVLLAVSNACVKRGGEVLGWQSALIFTGLSFGLASMVFWGLQSSSVAAINKLVYLPVLAGLFTFLGSIFLINALIGGKFAYMATIFNVSVTVTGALIGLTAFGEKISSIGFAGIAFSVIGVFLLSLG